MANRMPPMHQKPRPLELRLSFKDKETICFKRHLACSLLALQDLPPLGHHVRVQDIASWNIDDEDRSQNPRIQRPPFHRRTSRQPNQPALAANTERVEDIEGVIPAQSLTKSTLPNFQNNHTLTTSTKTGCPALRPATRSTHI